MTKKKAAKKPATQKKTPRRPWPSPRVDELDQAVSELQCRITKLENRRPWWKSLWQDLQPPRRE